ncbi:ependymin-related protein 2 [Magallana gigas]|uniref:ependymin-related protein 2 n=1 Tax=Magallana gigas TaxID=29159 RepID=UPI0033416BB8
MLCLLLLLLSVFGSSHQQCCFPSQWEGIEAGVMETVQPAAKVPISTKFQYIVSVDYSKHLLALSGTVVTAGKTSQIRVIRDFTSKVQYTLDMDANSCTKSLLTERELSCIGSNGDNSTLIANTYLGAGTQKIPISVYHSTLNGYPTTMSVSEGCIPVGASFHGTDEAGNNVIGSLGFSSITPGISNNAVFSIPAMCIAAPMANTVVG